jgi:hypothetical protein
MRSFLLLNVAMLACAMPALAQNSSSSGPAASPATTNANRQRVHRPAQSVAQAPPAVELPVETPVVTLRGVCEAVKKAESQDCKTVITRGQMDEIVARIATTAPQASHQQLVVKYVRMLAASQLAEDRKMETNPAVAAELGKQKGYGRIQVLAKAFYKQVEEAAGNATMDELQQYYAEHTFEFEEGEVLRLSLPISAYSRNGMRLDRARMKAEADTLRSRAIVGYDFDQLQALVYKDLAIPEPTPPTRLAMARANIMPEDQAQVFNLQPGEITPVIESYTKIVILKLVSKRVAPFESVLPEIKADVKQKRLTQEVESASKSVTADFNLQYLGTSAQPALFTLRGDTQSLVNGATPDQRRRAFSRRPMAANTAPTTIQAQTQSHP